MSLDPGRSSSPASSDTSQRAPRRAHEDALRKDKGYRRYASNVERALALFDTALQEWADYISFLSRLLKALQSHPPSVSAVPSKVVVAKRLAQCLNPSLPSGVHQKALEVYEYIFSLLKPDGLAHDLPLYLPGIAPTLTFASLSVRPAFLSLVETHIINLDPTHLRPALKAIILALLPGLEEETSEDFESTLRIVDKLRKNTCEPSSRSNSDNAGQYFWQCLFLASITNPTRRMGVLAYLNRHLPKLGGSNPWAALVKETLDTELADLSVAVDSLTQPEPGLLVRCFTTGLNDDQVLVQRNFLDLLVSNVPLHSPILQKRMSEKDLRLLISAAAGVVTRRDMSLNRRLWAWLLGLETASAPQESVDTNGQSSTAGPAADSAFDNEASKSRYFAQFGWRSLVCSIQAMINSEPLTPNERSKPFRISLSLMDRWEVGGLVVPEIFLLVMRSVQKYRQSAQSNAPFEEVFRSASAFFDGVESSLIFSELLGLLRLESSASKAVSASFVDDLKLISFIVSHFNMREEEMLVLHIPLLILALLLKMRAILSSAGDQSDYANMRQIALDEISSIVNRLLNLVPGRAFTRTVHGSGLDRASTAIDEKELRNAILNFYTRTKESLEQVQPPFLPKEMAELLLSEAHSLVLSAIESGTQLMERLNLLMSLLSKALKSNIFQEGLLLKAMHRKLMIADSASETLCFPVVSAITTAVAKLYSMYAAELYISYEEVYNIVPYLCRQLWEYLSPLNLRFHVEAVRCIWFLHSVTWHDHLVEASIAALMVSASASKLSYITTRDQADRFFVLWNHSNQANIDYSMFRGASQRRSSGSEMEEMKADYESSLLDRPLLILLDQLSLGPDSAAATVRTWLHDLPSVGKILHAIVARLVELTTGSRQDSKSSAGKVMTIPSNDASQCYYAFRTISNVVSSLGPTGWSVLTTSPSTDSEGPDQVQGDAEDSSTQVIIAEAASVVLSQTNSLPRAINPEEERMLLEVSSVLKQLLSGPGALKLVHLKLDSFLIEQLSSALDREQCCSLQGAILDALLPALKARFSQESSEISDSNTKNRRKSSLDALSFPRLSHGAEKPENEHTSVTQQSNPQLLQCVLKGISSRSSRAMIDKWIYFLSQCLPLYSSSIFQILLTLVESFCKEITVSYQDLQRMFRITDSPTNERSEHVIVALLTGLENTIATAHERLLFDEANVVAAKSPDQQQSFFGNMVSGVFAGEGGQTRNSAGSNRLTVLLCFQDAVRLCFSIWCWGNNGRSRNHVESESVASFQYTSLRMRNRSRRMLEHLFTAEPLECLETVVQLWRRSITVGDLAESRLIFSLLHTLNESRPKITVPAIFNAIYSRTNPSALEPGRQSALASQLSETELAAFLVTYARSLEDDMMDEIWSDCTTFLRDVLGNPFPHRQILLRLLEFAAILGEKMENTSFGDDRRTKKELADLLLRILTAIFTSKPLGLSQEAPDSSSAARTDGSDTVDSQQVIVPDDVLSILSAIMPCLPMTLSDPDRMATAMSAISVNVISPMVHSRLFPQNTPKTALDLIQQMSKNPSASKHWRKDVGDAFNDAKFFGTKPSLVQSNWLSILRQWIIADNDRMADLLSRLTTPTTAGIMFGVGASAARSDADRKTQLNLRRIALLVLAADEDHFSGELSTLHQKLEDVLMATQVSSPSSATRAEIYMVLRAIILRTSTIHLAPFWPTINTELHEVLSAVIPGRQSETYNPYSLLQGCKLLETLLVISPDDFQLQEWLFVTDTIDIVYPPDRWQSIALADEVSRDLGANVTEPTSSSLQGQQNEGEDGFKRSWLSSDITRETPKDDVSDKVLRPFFDRLSIHAFESTYNMEVPDLAACKDDLLADLFNEFTLVR